MWNDILNDESVKELVEWLNSYDIELTPTDLKNIITHELSQKTVVNIESKGSSKSKLTPADLLNSKSKLNFTDLKHLGLW